MNKKRLFTILVIITIFILLIIVGLVAATLGVVVSEKNSNVVNEIVPTTTTATPSVSVTNTDKTSTSSSIVAKTLSDTINSTQLMLHLEQLQTIANNNNKVRTLGTSGFQATVDYIETELRSKTNFQIFKQEFTVPIRATSNPILTSTISGVDRNYTYLTDFRELRYSPGANFLTSVRLTVVPNSGCSDDDWESTTPYPANNSVVLVIRSQNCTVEEKSIIAQKYNISGFLVYDRIINATDLPFGFVAENTTFPSMMLTYELGVELVEAVQNHSSTNPHIRIFITPGNSITVHIPTENICADTPTGNKTQTIVIGSHSDSAENTAGINDNGSGSMATLVLALNLAQLFQTSSYEKYLYRIRFCWWGAEEWKFRGSLHHIEEANTTTVAGNRLKDYVMMLNFDMIASPNYYFGILEGSALTDLITPVVQNSSLKIAQVFRNWFDEHKLPWDDSSLGISSDHVPFLEAGIPCGGTFSGDHTRKKLEQRDRYDRMLGHGYGGIFNAPYDPCYHEACDTIENANPFAFETLTKAAAYALETFGRTPNLYSWLYAPSSTTKNQ